MFVLISRLKIAELERSIKRMEENVQQKDNEIRNLQKNLHSLQEFMDDRDKYNTELSNVGWPVHILDYFHIVSVERRVKRGRN